MKPLIRWTMGDSNKQGIDVLRASVTSTVIALGRDNFEWIICSNANQSAQQIKRIGQENDIPVIQCKWSQFPLKQVTITGGSFWKLCPPRMAMDKHEIVLDNDVVIKQRFSDIDKFLSGNKILTCEEDVPFHGRYFFAFKPGQCLNSGIIGYPPGFDMEKEIQESWYNLGSFKRLNGGGDEQGLVTFTLIQHPHIIISKETVVQLMASGKFVKPNKEIIVWDEEFGYWTQKFVPAKGQTYVFTGEEKAFHFVSVNRRRHTPFQEYMKRNARVYI